MMFVGADQTGLSRRLTAISDYLLLWSAPFVQLGVVLIGICFIHSSAKGGAWASQVILGDGATWGGLLSGPVGWSFAVQVVALAFVTELGISRSYQAGPAIRKSASVLVFVALLAGCGKLVLALPLISAYREGGRSSIDLQWTAAPWIAFGGWIDVFLAIIFLAQIYKAWSARTEE